MFGEAAQLFIAARLPVFPVHTQTKRPAVKGWQQANSHRAKTWAEDPRLSKAEGIGLIMGPSSRITEVDIDESGEGYIARAFERFGESPIIIRSQSGNSKIWYRNNGEGRRIRPFPNENIDILGGGFTIAPPSIRSDLGTSYRFLRGGIEDIANLPIIRPGALVGGFQRAPEGVGRGERNNTAWRYAMVTARICDDVDQLVDAVKTWANGFTDRLSSKELEKCARSAWDYETQGRNFIDLKRPQVGTSDMIMDKLLDQPDALVLFQLLHRWHKNRSQFRIAPRPMSDAGNPPWDYRRIENARGVLIERGFLEQIKPPVRGYRAGIYHLKIDFI